MKLFIKIGGHIIRKSQIVSVSSHRWNPYPASRPYDVCSERLIKLRDGRTLSTQTSLEEIEAAINE